VKSAWRAEYRNDLVVGVKGGVPGLFIMSRLLLLLLLLLLLTAFGLTPGGSSTVHIYAQTVHTIQQYSTHLRTNSTHNTAENNTVTHKQITQYSRP
jgi:hypothetical protein